MDLQVGSDRRINSGIDCFAFIIDRQGIQRLADSCFTGIEFFADAIFFDRYRQGAFQLNNFPGLFFGICRRDQYPVFFADLDAGLFQNRTGIFKNSGHYFFLPVVTQNYFFAVGQTNSAEN